MTAIELLRPEAHFRLDRHQTIRNVFASTGIYAETVQEESNAARSKKMGRHMAAHSGARTTCRRS